MFERDGTPFAHGPLNYIVDRDGVFGGLQLGINQRSGHFFAGIEADVQGADISGSSSTFFRPPNVSPFTYSASVSTDWLATVRARLGFATDDLLIYVTGGFAVGDLNYNAVYVINPNAFANLSGDDLETGYVLGAGIERALLSNWSLKLEYQYIDFGHQTIRGFFPTTREIVETRFDTDFHTVRVGLNYHFHRHHHEATLK